MFCQWGVQHKQSSHPSDSETIPRRPDFRLPVPDGNNSRAEGVPWMPKLSCTAGDVSKLGDRKPDGLLSLHIGVSRAPILRHWDTAIKTAASSDTMARRLKKFWDPVSPEDGNGWRDWVWILRHVRHDIFATGFGSPRFSLENMPRFTGVHVKTEKWCRVAWFQCLTGQGEFH